MAYLLSQLWVWLFIALLLGVIVGWLTCSKETTQWWTGWVPWGVLAFIAGVLMAAFLVLSNRTAYMLETALLMFSAYIIGCCLSCLLKRKLGIGDVAVAAPVAAVAAATSVKPAAVAPAAVAAPVPKPSPAPLVTAVPKPVAAPVAVAAPLPKPAAAQVSSPISDGHPGRKPATLVTPRGGKADDLKRIRGIGQQNEGRLHALGIWHFDQIAAWVEQEVEWVGSYLAFPGRIQREEWLKQAKVLATGAETEFSKRVAKGDVATSKDVGDKGASNVADLSKITNATPVAKPAVAKAPASNPAPKKN